MFIFVVLVFIVFCFFGRDLFNTIIGMLLGAFLGVIIIVIAVIKLLGGF